MRVPKVHGLIRRRLLVNFRVDPEVIRRQLPPRFQPKLQAGYAIGGICLIRLEDIRPKRFPRLLGLSSENAAHRIAVAWETESGAREGVFIPRRDTGSLINHLAGGRLFPGEHHRATFDVAEEDDQIHLRMQSADGEVQIEIRGTVGRALPDGSVFASIAEASAFFEGGSLGYSATAAGNRLDGVTLKTERWVVEPLTIDHVYSSYFADASRFPAGSIAFDCALIMRNIAHEWEAADDMYV